MSNQTNKEKLVHILESLLEDAKNEKLGSSDIDILLSLLTNNEKMENEAVKSLFLGNFILNQVAISGEE